MLCVSQLHEWSWVSVEVHMCSCVQAWSFLPTLLSSVPNTFQIPDSCLGLAWSVAESWPPLR